LKKQREFYDFQLFDYRWDIHYSHLPANKEIELSGSHKDYLVVLNALNGCILQLDRGTDLLYFAPFTRTLTIYTAICLTLVKKLGQLE
jgi:hypothetical protein